MQDRLEGVPERLREPEQQRRREQSPWLPLAEDEGGESDEPTPGRHVLTELRAEPEGQIGAAHAGQHAREGDGRVADAEDREAHGVRRARMLADGAQPKPPDGAEEEPPAHGHEHECDVDHQVQPADDVSDQRHLSKKCRTDGMRGTSPEPSEPKMAFVP